MKCPTCKLPGGAENFHICVDLSYKARGESRVAVRLPRKLGKFENAVGMFANWSDRGSKSHIAETPN